MMFEPKDARQIQCWYMHLVHLAIAKGTKDGLLARLIQIEHKMGSNVNRCIQVHFGWIFTILGRFGQSGRFGLELIDYDENQVTDQNYQKVLID